MASETVSASLTIKSRAEAIFAVLIDPAKHVAIDGTGWVRDPLDRQLLTASRQSVLLFACNGSLAVILVS